MRRFPIEELENLPYVDHMPTDGRQVMLQVPYWDGTGDWHLYVEVAERVVGRMAGGEPVSGIYFGKTAADPSRDLQLPLGTLLIQHLSFPGVVGRLNQVLSDVFQLGALLDAYHLVVEQAPVRGASWTSAHAAAQTEQVLLCIRMLYDTIQGLVRQLAAYFTAAGGEATLSRVLPSSFADMVTEGGKLVKSSERLAEKRAIPPALAAWYFGEAEIFMALRNARDVIVHSGVSTPLPILVPEWGLAVRPGERIWKGLQPSWFVEGPTSSLVSLNGILVRAIGHVLDAMTRLATLLAASVELPPAIGEDLRVFMRSPMTIRLVSIDEHRITPWELRPR